MFCLCMFSSTFSIDGRMRSSRGSCWRSWTAIGAYVGGLGSGSGPGAPGCPGGGPSGPGGGSDVQMSI